MTPAQRITNYITELADWRGPMLARLRALILEAAPNITEEWKWDTPVFAYKGDVVAVGAIKDHVKLNFFKGAALSDPHSLFNAGLEAKATRAIDIHEGDAIAEAAIQESCAPPWPSMAPPAQIMAFGDDVEIAPAKSYINLVRGAKKFGIVQISPPSGWTSASSARAFHPRNGLKPQDRGMPWSPIACVSVSRNRSMLRCWRG